MDSLTTELIKPIKELHIGDNFNINEYDCDDDCEIYLFGHKISNWKDTKEFLKQLQVYKKALELACKNIYSRCDGYITVVAKTGANYGNVCNCPESEATKYFLDQSRKELGDENG